jgi:hypothetical protein
MSGKVVGFDYDSVTEKNRAWLVQITEKVRRLHERTASGAVEMGKYVLQAKERLPHGQFMGWVEMELPFGRDTAQRLMNVARVFGEVELRIVRNFETTAMYELSVASAPPTAREKAIEIAERGETVTRERAASIIASVPRPERAPRRGYFESKPDPQSTAAAAMVRGVLIERLDKAFTTGRLGELLGRDHQDTEVRERANELYHEIAQCLFPEEHADLGLVPDQLKRVNPANLEAFAFMMQGG